VRILVIEDETKVAAFIRQALQEEGHAVDLASDGDSGLRLAQASPYDLLVLDWLLPGSDGLSVCLTLRHAGATVPILMLTARDTVADRIAGLDAGADDYLVKPFALGELLARVRALLRRTAPGVATELTIGDLVLTPATRLARRGGRAVFLSAREYALLEYLMRNAGRTLSRSMIAEHVWDFDFDSGTNVVDVYINYLRNKLDRGRSVKLIHTVRGVGYRLEAGDA
jgi:DNA-binding response OmpR family regulator